MSRMTNDVGQVELYCKRAGRNDQRPDHDQLSFCNDMAKPWPFGFSLILLPVTAFIIAVSAVLLKKQSNAASLE